jgi:ABC-type sugar transport system permease subunit
MGTKDLLPAAEYNDFLRFFNIYRPQAQKVLILLAIAITVHITDSMRFIVLLTGIRRKNEILEIFLYYLFLVGTDTEEEK